MANTKTSSAPPKPQTPGEKSSPAMRMHRRGGGRPRLTAEEIIDLYFLDARWSLIEIAAFVDRVERAKKAEGIAETENDFRMRAFKRSLKILASDSDEKAKAIQLVFSDPTEQPLESAKGLKGAAGAFPGEAE